MNTTDLLDGLKSGAEVMAALMEGVSAEQAHAARGGDEGWSITEVLCHMRDVEERALERLTVMRDQDEPVLQSYDQDQLARERNYAADDPHAALGAFVALRQLHVEALSALTGRDWERIGRHTEYGPISIGDQSLHILAHTVVHAAQIARQLRGAAA